MAILVRPWPAVEAHPGGLWWHGPLLRQNNRENIQVRNRLTAEAPACSLFSQAPHCPVFAGAVSMLQEQSPSR